MKKIEWNNHKISVAFNGKYAFLAHVCGKARTALIIPARFEVRSQV